MSTGRDEFDLSSTINFEDVTMYECESHGNGRDGPHLGPILHNFSCQKDAVELRWPSRMQTDHSLRIFGLSSIIQVYKGTSS